MKRSTRTCSRFTRVQVEEPQGALWKKRGHLDLALKAPSLARSDLDSMRTPPPHATNVRGSARPSQRARRKGSVDMDGDSRGDDHIGGAVDAHMHDRICA